MEFPNIYIRRARLCCIRRNTADVIKRDTTTGMTADEVAHGGQRHFREADKDLRNLLDKAAPATVSLK